MKKVFLAVSVFALAFVSCKTSTNMKNYSETDSLSYAIGIDYGNHAKGLDSTMNVNVIAAAIADVIANNPKMTIEEAHNFLNEHFMVRVPARNLKEAEEFLAEVQKKNPNVKVTESGLMYEIIDEGTPGTAALNDADVVKVNYRGTLKDGTEFDRNDSISFPLNQVIPGWTEGMKLVGEGGKIKLWIPARLAYGERGSGRVPQNAAIVFDVDLLEVIPAQTAE